MKSLRPGQLVTVAREEGVADAIVADTSHLPKVVVSMLDDEGEAQFETVAVGRLRPRHDAGADDPALRALISASQAHARAGPPGSGNDVLKGHPGHSAPTGHRHRAR